MPACPSSCLSRHALCDSAGEQPPATLTDTETGACSRSFRLAQGLVSGMLATVAGSQPVHPEHERMMGVRGAKVLPVGALPQVRLDNSVWDASCMRQPWHAMAQSACTRIL